MEYNIRKYGPDDREAVRGICADTAVSGEPVEICFDDRDIAADILISYYIDFEPESCFVAENRSGVVIGYVAGSISARRRRKKLLLRVVPRALAKLISRRVLLRKKTFLLALDAVRAFLAGELSLPDSSKEYPACLHINVAEEFRGSGVGSGLLREHLEYLKEQGIRGVMLRTQSREAADFFAGFGFDVLFERRISHLPRSRCGRLFVMGAALRPGLS